MSIKNAIILLIITNIMIVAFLYIKDGIVKGTKEIRACEMVTDSLRKEIDSLNHEIFHHRTNLGRYEVALEILKEDDPQSAQKFQLILNTQTE